MNLKGHCFVAEDGHGFTTLPDLAKKLTFPDGTIAVVAAPGVTGFIRRQHYSGIQKIWTALLDIQEELYDPDRPSWRVRELKNEKKGLERALAFFTYGSDDEPSMKLIQAQAVKRYEAESE